MMQVRGAKDLVGFLFNDFFLLVKPKVFFHRAATPSDLDPFGKNEFQMYRKVGCVTPYLVPKTPPSHEEKQSGKPCSNVQRFTRLTRSKMLTAVRKVLCKPTNLL